MNCRGGHCSHGTGRTDRLYRNTQKGLFGGVCAGIADYTGVSVWVVRGAAILIFLMSNILALLAYIAAVFIIPRKPDTLYKDEKDEAFWRSMRRSPRETFGDARHKIRDLEKRLESIEAYVTSRRFNLDREFENLKD